MGKRFIKPDKEEIKRDFADYKRDFIAAVKDKKRWAACLIELLIMCVLIVADQLTKLYIYGHCASDGDIVLIDGVIRFTAVRNTGASFGIFQGSTGALTAVSLVCSILLVLFIFYSYPRKSKWLRAALVMITAGAIGNVIDRLAFGYVRDMVYFELIDFAVFNFADSCLTVGTVVLIIYIIFFYNKDEAAARKRREELNAQKSSSEGGEPNASKNATDEEGAQGATSERSDIATAPADETTERSDETTAPADGNRGTDDGNRETGDGEDGTAEKADGLDEGEI